MATALKLSTSARDQTNRNPLRLLAVAILFWCAAPGTVMAVDTQFGATVGVGYSDNIRRTEANPQSETIASVGADFSLREDSKRLYANVVADAQYLDYIHNSYDREFVGSGNAALNFHIAPGRFDWVFGDNFGQVRSDPFAPITPNNRENVNYFTTGPDFTVHAGDQNRLQLFGRYSMVNYQNTPVDNDRYAAGFKAIHDLSASSAVSANVQAERVKYKDAPASDYDNQQAFARYQLFGSRTQFGFDAGYSKLKNNLETHGGLLLRADFARKLTAASTLSLTAGREITDASASFRSSQSTGGAITNAPAANAQAALPTSNPYVSTYGTAAWEFARQRTTFGIGASYFKEQYELQPTSDRRRSVGTTHLSRRITPSFTASLTGSYTKEQFVNTPQESKDLTAGFRTDWRLSRLVSMDLEYFFTKRTGEGAVSAYRENRVWLQLVVGATLAQIQSQTTSSVQSRANPYAEY